MFRQSSNDSLVERSTAGDEQALAELFDRHRHWLRQMVQLQDAFLDLARELPRYSQKRPLPLLPWMRLVTGQRLAVVHRWHLGTEMRDAARDVSLDGRALPQADSASLAVRRPAADQPWGLG